MFRKEPNMKNQNMNPLNMIKRWIAFGLIASMVITVSVASLSPVGFATTEDLKKQQQKLKEVQDKLKRLNDEKYKTKKNQKLVNQQISATNATIRQIETEIKRINSGITSTTHSLNKTLTELDKANKTLEVKKDLLSKRLRNMYKSGGVGYAEVLMGANDFTDFLTRADMVQRIYFHDRRLVESIIAQKNTIEKKKNSLEQYKSQLQNLGQQRTGKQAALSNNLNSLETAQQKLKKDMAALEEQEDDLLKLANEITSMINKLTTKEKYVGGAMLWPAPGYYKINSPYGNRIHPIFKKKKMHTGIDIGIPYGKKIVAAQDGKVIYADWLSGYGKTVMIDHGGGIVTLYAHCSSLTVSTGDKVGKGDTVAKCGSTGNSTGAHLHFEVRVNGKYVDPMGYLK